MRTLILVFAAAVILLAPLGDSKAQEGDRIIAGPLVGGTFSQLLGERLKEIQAGYAVGLFARWQLSSSLAVRSEIMYAQRGGREGEEVIIDITELPLSEVSFRIHSIDWPILLEWALPGNTGHRPRALIGPVFNRVLKARGHSNYPDGKREFVGEDGQLQLGVVTGLGFYSGESKSWLFDLRMTWMLTSLSGPEEYRDRTVQVLIGYSFF